VPALARAAAKAAESVASDSLFVWSYLVPLFARELFFDDVALFVGRLLCAANKLSLIFGEQFFAGSIEIL
jgi:hypothetical protein